MKSESFCILPRLYPVKERADGIVDFKRNLEDFGSLASITLFAKR
jgi:hypothetical protein